MSENNRSELIDNALEAAISDLRWFGKRITIRGLVLRGGARLGVSSELIQAEMPRIHTRARLGYTHKMEASEVLYKILGRGNEKQQ